MYERLGDPEITGIPLVSQYIAGVVIDSYYDVADWYGACPDEEESYGGVVEIVQRLPGENLDDLVMRAELRAEALSESARRRFVRGSAEENLVQPINARAPCRADIVTYGDIPLEDSDILWVLSFTTPVRGAWLLCPTCAWSLVRGSEQIASGYERSFPHSPTSPLHWVNGVAYRFNDAGHYTNYGGDISHNPWVAHALFQGVYCWSADVQGFRRVTDPAKKHEVWRRLTDVEGAPAAARGRTSVMTLTRGPTNKSRTQYQHAAIDAACRMCGQRLTSDTARATIERGGETFFEFFQARFRSPETGEQQMAFLCLDCFYDRFDLNWTLYVGECLIVVTDADLTAADAARDAANAMLDSTIAAESTQAFAVSQAAWEAARDAIIIERARKIAAPASKGRRSRKAGAKVRPCTPQVRQ